MILGAHSRQRRKHSAAYLRSQGIAVRKDTANAFQKLLRSRKASRVAVAAAAAFAFSVMPYTGLLGGQTGNDRAPHVAHANQSHNIALTVKPHAHHTIPSRQLAASDLPTEMAPLKPYLKYIRHYSSHTSFTPALLAAMVFTESSGNPSAVSGEGALGIMQVEPNTALSEGVTNYATMNGSFKAGTIYIESLSVKYGLTRSDMNNAMVDGSQSGKKLDLVLAAYNAGEGAVARYGGVPPFQQTRDYIRKIRDSWMQILEREKGRIKPAVGYAVNSAYSFITAHSARGAAGQYARGRDGTEDPIAQKQYISGFSEHY